MQQLKYKAKFSSDCDRSAAPHRGQKDISEIHAIFQLLSAGAMLDSLHNNTTTNGWRWQKGSVIRLFALPTKLGKR